jgi:hypothetical protein
MWTVDSPWTTQNGQICETQSCPKKLSMDMSTNPEVFCCQCVCWRLYGISKHAVHVHLEGSKWTKDKWARGSGGTPARTLGPRMFCVFQQSQAPKDESGKSPRAANRDINESGSKRYH